MSRIQIIAEAGVNHNGSIELALQLIDAAAKAGADVVKFQTFKAEKLASKEAKIARYAQYENAKDARQIDMLKRLELDESAYPILMKRCAEKEIEFLSTGFDEDSLEMLISLGMERVKIPSGEITNLPYLRAAAQFKLPIIISTGMANEDEVEAAVNALLRSGLDRSYLTILHCTTEYPAPYKDINLLAMKTMQKRLGIAVGYSDHSEGSEVAIAAAALGATIIEKHFTIDKTLAGPDHKASLEPSELAYMISAIRHIELALGDGIKKPQMCELQNRNVVRKSVHLKCAVSAGDALSKGDFVMIRPGDGISPMKIDELIGKRVIRSLPAHHKLGWQDFVD